VTHVEIIRAVDEVQPLDPADDLALALEMLGLEVLELGVGSIAMRPQRVEDADSEDEVLDGEAAATSSSMARPSSG